MLSRRMGQKKGHLKLCEVAADIRQILIDTRLERVFDIRDTETAAWPRSRWKLGWHGQLLALLINSRYNIGGLLLLKGLVRVKLPYNIRRPLFHRIRHFSANGRPSVPGPTENVSVFATRGSTKAPFLPWAVSTGGQAARGTQSQPQEVPPTSTRGWPEPRLLPARRSSGSRGCGRWPACALSFEVSHAARSSNWPLQA